MPTSEVPKSTLSNHLNWALTRDETPDVIIGVDPGGTTGISIFSVRPDELPELISSEQWTEPNDVSAKLLGLDRYFRSTGRVPLFVIEQFDKRPGVINPDYTPMYIIKDIHRDMDEVAEIVWQIPSVAKNLIKPAKSGMSDQLKRFGWYVKGMGHANDATRHVLVYLVHTLKHMPTIRHGWPRRDGS